MKNYTMVEFPFRALIRQDLRKIELMLLSEMCRRAEKDGFLSEENMLFPLENFLKDDWFNLLTKLFEKEYFFLGPRSEVNGEVIGRYLMFGDDKQHLEIFGKH